MHRISYSLCISLILMSACPCGTVASADGLETTLDKMVEDGRLVAAQAVVGRGDDILVSYASGVTVPGGKQKVDDETLFCIGSCSKPFASAVVMSLVEDGTLKLEQPIDKYLPSFKNLVLANGEAIGRAPTLKELLTHRGGIYSQHTKKMTAAQTGWIRNFGLTLEESVKGISAEPLNSRPGSEYAYSGAGYCVAGRVAEVVASKPFEELLQHRIARPLQLKRTTYFPKAKEINVAAGGSKGVANRKTPHLSKPELRFPLIGGSLYSTAEETARFLRMVTNQGKHNANAVMKPTTWSTWTSRPYADGSYGFGWGLAGQKPPAHPVLVRHSGSLASSRSLMAATLNGNVYYVVNYTVAVRDPSLKTDIESAVVQSIKMKLAPR